MDTTVTYINCLSVVLHIRKSVGPIFEGIHVGLFRLLRLFKRPPADTISASAFQQRNTRPNARSSFRWDEKIPMSVYI